MTSELLKEYLQTNCGEVATLKMLTWPDSGRCRGMAYVSFGQDAATSKALDLDGEKMGGGRWLQVAVADTRKGKGGKGGPKGGAKGGGKGGGRGGRGANGTDAPDSQGAQGRACYRCGKRGHDAQSCTRDRICYRCKSTAHLSKDCPKRKSATA